MTSDGSAPKAVPAAMRGNHAPNNAARRTSEVRRQSIDCEFPECGKLNAGPCGLVDRARIGSWRAAPNEGTSDSATDYIGGKKRPSNLFAALWPGRADQPITRQAVACRMKNPSQQTVHFVFPSLRASPQVDRIHIDRPLDVFSGRQLGHDLAPDGSHGLAGCGRQENVKAILPLDT
jgi:hypothetical protein